MQVPGRMTVEMDMMLLFNEDDLQVVQQWVMRIRTPAAHI